MLLLDTNHEAQKKNAISETISNNKAANGKIKLKHFSKKYYINSENRVKNQNGNNLYIKNNPFLESKENAKGQKVIISVKNDYFSRSKTNCEKSNGIDRNFVIKYTIPENINNNKLNQIEEKKENRNLSNQENNLVKKQIVNTKKIKLKLKLEEIQRKCIHSHQERIVIKSNLLTSQDNTNDKPQSIDAIKNSIKVSNDNTLEKFQIITVGANGSDPKKENVSLRNIVQDFSYKENKNHLCREYMEDFGYLNSNFASVNENQLSLFAIFDGHNGSDVALYLKNNFHTKLKSQLLENKNTEIEDSIAKTFLDIDTDIANNIPNSKRCGSTATIVLIYKKKLYIANVGDSHCYVIRKEQANMMTCIHNCSNIREVERIKKSGGMVFMDRVFGSLSITRSFGDFEFKSNGLTAVPFISKVPVDKDTKFCVLASDGVWDVIDGHKIKNLCMKYADRSAEEICEKIINASLMLKSQDNLSCIVIKF